MNASQFIIEAKKIISGLHKNGHIPILVGGSGFYLRALIKGMYQCPSPSEQIVQANKELFEKEGIAPFLLQLKKIDPQSYSRLHPNDYYRIIRAIEFYQATNKPISEEKERLDSKDPYDFSKSQNLDWDIFHNYLDLPKDDHQLVIEKRTQKMIKDGLIEEVESLLQEGFSGKEKPLQSIGYKETLAYLQGQFKNRKEYIERINISTRQLAKAQRTFFNKIKHKKVFNPLNDLEHSISQMTQFIRE
jgi:tRNA dimethylallyltransferase